jgi:hypothetical protein
MCIIQPLHPQAKSSKNNFEISKPNLWGDGYFLLMGKDFTYIQGYKGFAVKAHIMIYFLTCIICFTLITRYHIV